MKPLPPEHWESVASIYVEAANRGRPPALAVQNSLGVPRSTARRYVQQARRLGLLPPTTKGKHSHQNATLLAVAQAVGVPASALHAAVVEHARGRLCVSPRFTPPLADPTPLT